MRRILILSLALAFTLSPFAQTKKPQQKAKTTVKRTAPVQKKTTTTAKKAVPVKKTATTQKKSTTTKKATTKKTATTQKKPVYTNTEIKAGADPEEDQGTGETAAGQPCRREGPVEQPVCHQQ